MRFDEKISCRNLEHGGAYNIDNQVAFSSLMRTSIKKLVISWIKEGFWCFQEPFL